MDRIWLGIDTSTAVSVGVARDGEVLVSMQVDERNAHAEQLMPTIVAALEEAGLTLADVTDVAVGLGPGPFTGLRVGIVTAQALAHVNGLPLKGVCSLDVLAAAWAPHATGEFVACSDARRKELYWARYAADGTRLSGPEVTAPEDLPDLPVVGPGADVHPAVHRGRAPEGPRVLDAGLLAAKASVLPSAGTEPLYLRRPDATVPGARKSALALAERTQ